MSDSVGLNPSIQQTQLQGAPVATEKKIQHKPIEQETSRIGIQSFKAMDAEISDIRTNKSIVFNPGKSANNAACRHLSNITKNFVAENHSFPSKTTSREVRQGVFSANELPNTLSSIAKGVSSGVVSREDGARILQFASKQTQLYTEWGQSVKKFIGENEGKLIQANLKDRPGVEDNIRKAKGALRQIEFQSKSLKEGVSKLESNLKTVYGDNLNVSTQTQLAGTNLVYRLVRNR